MNEGTVTRVGPFSWIRDDHGSEEAWRLTSAAGTTVVGFCLKNYGGEPREGSSFSGWRLVSGGPFCAAGGWTSRQDAMNGCVPWLMSYLQARIEERRAELVKKLGQLAVFESEISL